MNWFYIHVVYVYALASPQTSLGVRSSRIHFSRAIFKIQAHLRGGGGLFNLERTMVSVLHKEEEYGVEKFKYKKF